VYSRVLEKSLANINSLKGLAEDTSSLYQIMMEGRIDNTRAVNSEVIQRALRGSRFGAVEHYRNLLQAQRQLACLESRQETLREKAFEASLSNTNEAAMVTMLEGEATRTRADIAAMEAQLAAANPWDEVEDLQNSLAQARESLATQQKRLQELRPAVASQAGMTAEQQQALEQRIDHLRQQVSSDRDQINQALRQVLLSLRDDYRELAGDAQLGRASMLQLYASN
jgi:prophage DNA circulation protein